MKVYTYPVIYRLFYKYGNIPLTFFLFLFVVPLIVDMIKKPIYILPVIISLLMIYYMNRSFLQFYKILSYKITYDGDKITCTDFIFGKKRIVFSFNEITSLEGGIFNGRLYGVMKIKLENNLTVGFFHTIKNAKELETTILKNVKRPIYDQVVYKVNSLQKQEEKAESK